MEPIGLLAWVLVGLIAVWLVSQVIPRRMGQIGDTIRKRGFLMSQIRLGLAAVVLVALSIGLVVDRTTAQNGKDDKVTICHVAGNTDDPANYVTITISKNGLNGHFDQNGTPRQGHESDFMGECPPSDSAPVDEPPDAGEGDNDDTAEACGEFVEGDQEFPQVNENDCPDSKKVTICHVAGNSDDPANYVTITISENGLNGHFNNDGTPRQGHQDDIMGPCPTTTSPEQPQEPAAFVPIVVGPPVCEDVLVYHTNQTGDWEIFRLGDADTLLNLSQGVNAIDVAPSMSPDKRWITFVSNRDGNWELYTAAMDGSSVQRLTYNNFTDADPMWSPDGKSIVFQSTREGERDLYLFDVTGGQEVRLTENVGNNTNAFWSPDGSKLVFQSNRDGLWQIYELTLSSLAAVRLTDGSTNTFDPQYSTNGTQISYRVIDGSGHGVIYVMNADGSTPRVISDPNGDALYQAWSPDDSAIAYQSSLDGDRDIYVYDLANNQTRLLADNTAADYAPTWFCGSKQLAFTSEVTGNADIFSAQALPVNAASIIIEEQATQLTVDPAADLYPLSSPSEEDASRSRSGELISISAQ